MQKQRMRTDVEACDVWTQRAQVAIMLVLVCATCVAHGSVYYVSTGGNDANPGTADAPWRSIQAAANRVLPGDTVRVLEGSYSERVTTARGGTGEDARITFEAVGRVIMRGWVINHAYISIVGFELTGHSAQYALDAYVRINSGGDFARLERCIIRDGVRVVSAGATFASVSNEIRVPEGGLIGRGFQAGMYIAVERATYPQTLMNKRQYKVVGVSNDMLTVDGGVVDEGPVPVYISASVVYGVYVAPGAEGCVLHGNVFQNLGYDAILVGGKNCLIAENVIRGTHGWDAIHYGGTNNVFVANIIESGEFEVYQVSPDAFENYTPIPYENIVISNNVVLGFQGVLGAQKGAGTMRGLRVVRNLFVDVGRLSITHPATVIENNVFLRAAKTNNPVMARSSHAVVLHVANGATNCAIRNNVFVDCGQPVGPAEADTVGWYELRGDDGTTVVGGNAASGSPPEFRPRLGWREEPALNGGEPGFVDIDDPLGPDGVPFTADDGLRPRADSKLVRAGVGGATIGAYELPYVESVPLGIVRLNDREVGIRWPRSIWNWTVEWAPNPQGPWSVVARPLEATESGWQVRVPADEPGMWFRLRR
jgi:hypothetical protein